MLPVGRRQPDRTRPWLLRCGKRERLRRRPVDRRRCDGSESEGGRWTKAATADAPTRAASGHARAQSGELKEKAVVRLIVASHPVVNSGRWAHTALARLLTLPPAACLQFQPWPVFVLFTVTVCVVL